MYRLLLTSCSHYCTVHDNQTMIRTFLDFKINYKFNYLSFSQQCGENTFCKTRTVYKRSLGVMVYIIQTYIRTHAHTHT